MNKIYAVVFKNSNKPYNFTSDFDVNINDEVIVETEKGLQYGKIVNIFESTTDEETEYKTIVRIATKEDTEKYYKNLKDADEAMKKCKKLVEELKLDMSIINAAYTFDRSQLLINFSADDRIDFRELAKKLAAIYRTRIELRQIGARDKAKIVGGIGICGQKLCCANFLHQLDSISMSKAKNQNLALNPNKINGCCGRLLCCLCYEDEEYVRCSKDLLNVGAKIKYNGEDAIIIGVDILNRKYKILVGDTKIDILAEELNNGSKK